MPTALSETVKQPAEFPRRPPAWGAAAIGKRINRTARQVYHLYEQGALPGARKVGGVLVHDPDNVLGA